jgi:capsular exopolysaccharide synthesis family protein
MFGVGVAMFLEYLDDTIQTADDAETISQIPTLGIIPWLRSTSDAQLITLSDPRSPAAESYRTLRTNIKFLSTDSPLHTMTITSAGPEEGKSTTIANLGVSFAQTGKKVLIVDTDMRKPTIHAIFGLRSDIGVTSVLAGDMPLEQAIQGTEAENLHVLTCGPIPPNPAELLESQRFATLLEEVKSRYDVVLFDAPPIIAVTDASILAAKLDGLILLMGVNKVTRKAAKHALQLLASARVKVWGMVVRGVRPDNDGYYYAYYHRYYGTMERDRKKADKKSRARRSESPKTAVVPQARPAAGEEPTGDVLIDINKLKKG